MSIGYACITVGVQNTDQKSCILKNACESKLSDIIFYNLNSLENVINYNLDNDIKLFRISSDLIPFGSSPVNKLPWWDMFEPQLKIIGRKAINSGMRLSMHPGQYTVLNSPNPNVVENAVADLNYHTRVLDSLGLGPEHKIVLHIGGIYNDKQQAIRRFIANYSHLDDSVKRRLVIENDDKLFNIYDVLDIGIKLNIPVIFDNLHNEINPSDPNKTDSYWINLCKGTWKASDGRQKIHYSQQDPEKKPGSHSSTISINSFVKFYMSLESKNIDIMLEVKDKNLSAVKCINCLSDKKRIKALELEWSKYKYTVLERSPSAYSEIRRLLNNKSSYPAIELYNIIEDSLKKQVETGNAINAAQHVWGYFKEMASVKEKESFSKNIQNFEQGKISINTIKNSLLKMTVKYNEQYLLNSYYFLL